MCCFYLVISLYDNSQCLSIFQTHLNLLDNWGFLKQLQLVQYSIMFYPTAVLIAETFQFNKELIQKVNTADLNQLAKRPATSGFIIDKAIKELDFKPTTIKDSLVEIQQALA